METTTNQKRFTDYYQLASRMIEATDKDTLAEVARILAIHVCWLSVYLTADLSRYFVMWGEFSLGWAHRVS